MYLIERYNDAVHGMARKNEQEAGPPKKRKKDRYGGIIRDVDILCITRKQVHRKATVVRIGFDYLDYLHASLLKYLFPICTGLTDYLLPCLHKTHLL